MSGFGSSATAFGSNNNTSSAFGGGASGGFGSSTGGTQKSEDTHLLSFVCVEVKEVAGAFQAANKFPIVETRDSPTPITPRAIW